MFLKFTIERTINVSKEVCLWNTWDHEHLYFVHKQFKNAKILIENQKSVVIETRLKVPFIPFEFSCLHSLFEAEDRNVVVIDTLPFGAWVKLEMNYREIGNKQTRLENNYRIYLPFYMAPLLPFLKSLIIKWNNINWEEDLPLKKRRQMALDLGFRDFRGRISSPSRNTPFSLPIRRTKSSHIDINL
jgi:hypothetical protein